MSEKQGRKPTGRVNYIWVLAAGYLIYLAYKLFSGLWKGDAENVLMNLIGGVVFLAAAVWMLLREWRAYQYGKAHIDDPSTWSDDLEEEADSQIPAAEETAAALEEPEDDGQEEKEERP